MSHAERILFLQRRPPSGNMVLIKTSEPVLVDSGFSSVARASVELVRRAGVEPERLRLLINTHFHSDHVGANHLLQQTYGVPIAASRQEGMLVNQRHPDACDERELDHPIAPYHVDRLLDDGELIDAGEVTLRAIASPGHTEGHLSFWIESEGVLIAGDTFHASDVAWLNLARDGTAALDAIQGTLERFARLGPRRAYSGHGPAIEHPLSAIDAARRRYDRWRNEPRRAAWHAMKRAVAFSLMYLGSMTPSELRRLLLGAGWFRRNVEGLLECEAEELIEPLLAELHRSGAVREVDGRLEAAMAYDPPPPDWDTSTMRVRFWPAWESSDAASAP